jgi:hypothetical protein
MIAKDFRGTIPFISPEMILFKYKGFYNSIESDVFSIGMLLISIFDQKSRQTNRDFLKKMDKLEQSNKLLKD